MLIIFTLTFKLIKKNCRLNERQTPFRDIFVRPEICHLLHTPALKSTSVGMFQCWRELSHRSTNRNAVQRYCWPKSSSNACWMEHDVASRGSSVQGNPKIKEMIFLLIFLIEAPYEMKRNCCSEPSFEPKIN